MADVFISYAHPDRAFVDKLADLLRASELSVWFDRSLTVGEEFSVGIERPLRVATGRSLTYRFVPIFCTAG